MRPTYWASHQIDAEKRSLFLSYASQACYVVQEFNTIWHSWLTLFSFMMTGFEFGMFYDCSNPEAATILMVLYMFVVAVIFLNLLIGIMADSWKTVSFSYFVSFIVMRSQPCFDGDVLHEYQMT